MGDHVKRRRSDSIASGPESKRPNMNSDGHDQPPESDQPEPVSATDENHSPASPSAPPAQEAPVKSTYITIRALIVTQDASIIIGKGGAHIRDIRENSGSKVSVSEAIRGCAERVLFCSGPLDAVAKGFGLIVRRINDEPFDSPSVPGSRAVTVRFIVPNAQIGMVIGKGGAKIREIQEASGAKLQASDAMLPDSTDRLLTVSGVADAVHIAIYYVGSVLLDYTSQAVDNRQYRPSARSSPQSNPRDSFGAMPPPRTRDEAAYFARGQEGYGSMPPGRTGGPPSTSRPHGQVWSSTGNMPNAQVQQLFIPEQYVSAIIGPKGRSINEIRASSATTIKIMEPSEQAASDVRGQPGERLVTITGQPSNLQMAVQMLHARLEEVSQTSRA